MDKIEKKLRNPKKKKEGEVRSPCIKKCSLDQNNICTGCHRRIDEIILWPDADNSVRRKIIEAAERRQSRNRE
jgi:predicted Fe-S protein YdhL (DUF1289 family)